MKFKEKNIKKINQNLIKMKNMNQEESLDYFAEKKENIILLHYNKVIKLNFLMKLLIILIIVFKKKKIKKFKMKKIKIY